MKYNDKWRHDARRRIAAQRLLEAQESALLEAQKLIEAAYEILLHCPNPSQSSGLPTMIRETRFHTFGAKSRINDCLKGWPKTETYIGNMAAAGEGLFDEDD